MLWVIYLAIAVQLLPVLAVLRGPWPPPRARAWLALWCATFFVGDMAHLTLARWGETRWLYAIQGPIEALALLMAFSYWQTGRARLAFRLAIPALVLTGLVWPSSAWRSLVLAVAVAGTLAQRVKRETDLRGQDWYWAGFGVLLYYAAYLIVEPVAASLITSQRMSLARGVYVAKAAVDVVAFLLIWFGMRRRVALAILSGTSSTRDADALPLAAPEAGPRHLGGRRRQGGRTV